MNMNQLGSNNHFISFQIQQQSIVFEPTSLPFSPFFHHTYYNKPRTQVQHSNHLSHNTTMLDPATQLVPPPSSPTNSSISSSDLDTESTGSFFHDRSTTLGTLMGVSFPTITFRASDDHRHSDASTVSAAVSGPRRAAESRKKKAIVAAERRRRWWWLCREGDTRPASLGEFLEVERRCGEGAFYGTEVELEGMVTDPQRNHGRALFSDGRVLPPSIVDDGASTEGNLCSRFPVLLTGICSGGAG